MLFDKTNPPRLR